MIDTHDIVDHEEVMAFPPAQRRYIVILQARIHELLVDNANLQRRILKLEQKFGELTT